MAKNSGKKFEDLIKQSAEEQGWDYTRFRDAGGWSKSSDTRFTVDNICDCILFNGELLYYVEAKVSKTRSISFARLKQLNDLLKKNRDKVVSGFFCKTSDGNFFIEAKKINKFLQSTKKKSFSMVDAMRNGAYEIREFVPPGKRSPRLLLSDLSEKREELLLL